MTPTPASPIEPVRRGRCGGFTLIELIVAVTMSVVILAALWTLLRVYTDLFDRGQARVAEAQLGRALLLQMADDLHAAVQDPLGGAAAPAGAGPQRRFGLFGTAQELRFDVLQTRPPDFSLPTDDPLLDAEQEEAAPRVPELRTIYYGFTPPTDEREEPQTPAMPAEEELAEAPPPGLVRRELGYETAGPDPAARPSGEGSVAATGAVAGEEDPAAEELDAMTMPEVVACQFRYFDGQGWQSQWNSIAQAALPVAVEVTIQLADPAALAREEDQDPTDPATLEEPWAEEPEMESSPEATAQDGTETEPAALPAGTYRLVIDLPGSPKHPAPEAVSAVLTPAAPAALAPRPAPAPRIAPPRWTPAAPAPPQRLPDQWMRTSP